MPEDLLAVRPRDIIIVFGVDDRDVVISVSLLSTCSRMLVLTGVKKFAKPRCAGPLVFDEAVEIVQ